MRAFAATAPVALLAAALLLGMAGASRAQEAASGAEEAPPPPPPPPTSEGLAQLLHDLVEREQALRSDERDLAERERSVAELEARAMERLAEVEAIRAEVEARITAYEEQSGDQVTRLAKMYAAMPPARVAPLLQQLPRELATSVLTRMREKSSAAILAVLPPEEAVALSKRIARPLGAPARAAR